MVRSALLFAAAALTAYVGASSNAPIDILERQDLSAQAGPGKGKGNGPPKTKPKPKPKVDSKKLQASIKESALRKKGKELENAAYSTPQRNRVFSSPGHANTLDFIEGYLDTVSDYYTYRRQEFQALYSQASGNFSASGEQYAPIIFQYSPSGSVEAQLVPVANQGCAASDYPAGLTNNIALISRGTCEFGLKSALAGAAGASGALLYNNAPGSISGGTLGPPPRPEGDYVPTAGITQEQGLELLQAINAGQTITGLLEVDSVIENRTT